MLDVNKWIYKAVVGKSPWEETTFGNIDVVGEIRLKETIERNRA
jgi:hypothetical protein